MTDIIGWARVTAVCATCGEFLDEVKANVLDNNKLDLHEELTPGTKHECFINQPVEGEGDDE